MYSLLTDLFPGAVAGGIISWLLRGWISERLKQAIAHEYSSKLENLKNELNSKLESLKHTYEIGQLRTSLFFDHQRIAFAEILAKVAEINQEWWNTHDPETGLTEPVPSDLYQSLRELYAKHQLFLDSDSIMALELLFEMYADSFPFWDGDKLHPRDPTGPFASAKYLQPRLAALFQQKIGVAIDTRAVRQLALLGAIRTLNRYHFAKIEIPVKGALELDAFDEAAEAVMKAERNLPELVERMRSFRQYLQTETAFFHEAEVNLGRYLEILDQQASATI